MENKLIRFIDSDYHFLFSMPDGGNVVLTRSDGERVVRPCEYLDSHHTRIGSCVYHICEFAERMEANGTTYTPEMTPPLPELCYSTMPSTGELIVIEQGKMGYSPCGYSEQNRERNEKMAARLNEDSGISKQQEAAMVAGALSGWDAPAADPANYDGKGKPLQTKKPPQRSRAER